MWPCAMKIHSEELENWNQGHLIYFAQGCDYPSTLEYNKDGWYVQPDICQGYIYSQ